MSFLYCIFITCFTTFISFSLSCFYGGLSALGMKHLSWDEFISQDAQSVDVIW